MRQKKRKKKDEYHVKKSSSIRSLDLLTFDLWPWPTPSLTENEFYVGCSVYSNSITTCACALQFIIRLIVLEWTINERVTRQLWFCEELFDRTTQVLKYDFSLIITHIDILILSLFNICSELFRHHTHKQYIQ